MRVKHWCNNTGERIHAWRKTCYTDDLTTKNFMWAPLDQTWASVQRLVINCMVWPSNNVVGIATVYGLDGLGIKPWWGARFSAPVQTGPGAHPASCTMGTRSFPGVNSSRCLTLTPHPLLVPRSRRSRAVPQCLYRGALYLFFYDLKRIFYKSFTL